MELLLDDPLAPEWSELLAGDAVGLARLLSMELRPCGCLDFFRFSGVFSVLALAGDLSPSLSREGELVCFSDSISAALNCCVMSSCFFCFAAHLRQRARLLSEALLKLHLDPSALTPVQRSL